MKRSFVSFGWFVCLFMVLFSPVLGQGDRALVPVDNRRGEASALIGDYHLLAIGINDYSDPQLRLRTAVNDARMVAEVLKDRWGFEERNVTLLLDGDATDDAIERELRRLIRETRPEDAVMVYFAGHGHLDEYTDEGSWIPVNASFTSPSRWVSNARVRSLIRAMPARAVLLVSDSCFAGDFFRGDRGVPPEIDDAYVREAMRKRARQALTSGGLEPVMDDGGGGHSVFANFFLAELRQSDSPYLLPRDLHRRVAGGVALNAPQQPLIGDLRDTGAELGGEFIFFRRGHSRDWEEARRQREAQLSELARAEEEARVAQRQRDAEEAAKAAEIAELDRRIREMQERLGRPGGGEGGTLQDMVALVRQQEAQAAELERMRQRAEQERQDRERRIAELRAQQAREAEKAFEEDYALYEEILASAFATEAIKRQAWAEITSKYGIQVDGENIGKLSWGKGQVLLYAGPVEGRNSVISLSEYVNLSLTWIQSMKMWVGTYEVTNAEFRVFNKSHNSGEIYGFGLNGDRQPVVSITYHDAVAFCRWLTSKQMEAGQLPNGYEFRLPTDEEWTLFAKCGTNRSFPWGQWMADMYGNYADASAAELFRRVNNTNFTYMSNYNDGFPVSAPVELSGVNDWGLYGVGGNVNEFVTTKTGSDSVSRGGSYFTSSRHSGLDVEKRHGGHISNRGPSNSRGFRLVLARIN